MLIRLGYSSGRQEPGDDVPRMRGLTLEFAVRPGGAECRTETSEGRMPAPDGSPAVARRPLLLADRPAVAMLARKSEQPVRLETLCTRFLSEASGYGFRPEEIEQTVRQLSGSGD